MDDVAERKQNWRELAFWAIFIVVIIALAVFVWYCRALSQVMLFIDPRIAARSLWLETHHLPGGA